MKNSLNLDKQCLEIARKQFCLDIGLPWEAYEENRGKTVLIQRAAYAPGTKDVTGEGARNYSERDSFFRAIICLGQLFICCDESIYDWVVEQYENCKPEWFCDFKNLRKLDEKLKEYGHEIYDTHVYFLPEDSEILSDAKKNHPGSCGNLKLAWYDQEEILRFKENNRFTSAISFWARHPDMLAAASMKEGYPSEPKDFDQKHMSGMAGVSRDGEYLWQIGINVDKEYAGKGLGHGLVRVLKDAVLRMGKVPFYGTSESHTLSQTVGLKAGFAPAWTEVSVRETPKR